MRVQSLLSIPLAPRHKADTLRQALAALIVLAAAFPAQAGTTLSDGDFSDSAWTRTPLGNAPADFATAEQVTTGGNPGAYRHTIVNPADTYHDALNVRTGWVYDPETQGAITRIDWSIDVLKIGNPVKGYSGIYNLVVVQNGVVFEDYGKNAGVQASEPGWFSWPAFINRKQNDFLNISGSGPENPDFSRNGSPLQFGYVASGPQRGGQSGIDNLLIEINGGGGGGDEVANLTGDWQNPLIIKGRPGRRGTTIYTLEALTVINNGTKKAGGKQRNKRPKTTFFLSDDDLLDEGDVKVGTMTLDPLKPGAFKRYELKFTLPSNINLKKASGKFLIAVIDSNRKVTETDESDNLAIAGIP